MTCRHSHSDGQAGAGINTYPALPEKSEPGMGQRRPTLRVWGTEIFIILLRDLALLDVI